MVRIMIPIHDAFINSSKEWLYLFSLSAISSGAEACKVSATDESNEIICDSFFLNMVYPLVFLLFI
jgi:hypothetical protein